MGEIHPLARVNPDLRLLLFLLALSSGVLGLTYLTLSAISPATLYLICGIATAENTPALTVSHVALGLTGILSALVLGAALLLDSGFAALLGILLSLATAVNLAFMPGARPLPLSGAALITGLSMTAFLRLGNLDPPSKKTSGG